MFGKVRGVCLYLWVALLVSVDQIVKVWILNNFKDDSVVIIKNVLKFTYCENKGVAFNFGDGHVPVFIIVNLLMICGLLIYFEKNRGDFKSLAKVFFIMTIAGGISNVIDRIFRGFVVDFINFNDIVNFAIFNVADIFIVVGVIGLACCFIFKGIKESKREGVCKG